MKKLWVKISYWWFVIMLFLVGLFTGKLDVKAASLSITSDSGWSGYYCATTTGGQCGSKTSTGKTAFGTGKVLNNNQYYPLYGSASLFYGSSNFLATNTYTLSFRSHFNFYNPNDISYQKKNAKKWTYIVNGYVNSSVGYSDSYIKDFSCSSRFDTTTTNGFITTCTFQLNSNVARIQVVTSYYDESEGADIYYLANSMRENFISLNYSEGVGSQIDNQTIVIENSIHDIEDAITDDNVENPSSSISEMQDLLPTNGTITNLIALPINLYTKVLNSINGTCQSFNLGSLYGTNLVMPCVDLNNYLGNTLWNTIDLIISGVFIYTIVRKMIKAFNNFTSLKEGDVIND